MEPDLTPADTLTSREVTALIVAYQAADTIHQAIDSIRAQVGCVIVVVDGATDETAKIAAKALRNSPHKIHINAVNEGVGAARSLALGLATTDWIVWQDADDISEDNRVELLLAEARLGADMVYDQPSLVTPGLVEAGPSLPFPDFMRDQKHLPFQLARNYIPAHWPLERRSLAAEVGFRTDLKGAEDFDHQLRMMLSRARVGAVRSNSYQYVDHPGSLSRKISQQVAAYHRVLSDLDVSEVRDWLKAAAFSEAVTLWITAQFNLRCGRYEDASRGAEQGYNLSSVSDAVGEPDHLPTKARFAFLAASSAWCQTDYAAAKLWLERTKQLDTGPDVENNLGCVNGVLGKDGQPFFHRALKLRPGYRDAAVNCSGQTPFAYTLLPLRRAAGRQSYTS